MILAILALFAPSYVHDRLTLTGGGMFFFLKEFEHLQ